MDNIVDAELRYIQDKLSQESCVEVVTCVRAMVRVKIKQTERKELTLLFQFQDNYPDKPIIIELKSKTLSDSLLTGLNKLLEEEAEKFVGEAQISRVVLFARKFLSENTLAVCHDEIMEVKRSLLGPNDELKLKQKTAQLVLKLNEKRYFIHARLTVTEDYPKDETIVEITSHNFPELLKKNFTSQAVEIARRSVKPPLKKKPKDSAFEPKPAVRPICKYLIEDIVRRYPNVICTLCHQSVLPDDPSQVSNVPNSDVFVERVYCADLFHHKCLDDYMKTPPFEGGKPCPGPHCGKRIYHQNWHISPQLAEARWAAKEAKHRELEEVADFFQ